MEGRVKGGTASRQAAGRRLWEQGCHLSQLSTAPLTMTSGRGAQHTGRCVTSPLFLPLSPPPPSRAEHLHERGQAPAGRLWAGQAAAAHAGDGAHAHRHALLHVSQELTRMGEGTRPGGWRAKLWLKGEGSVACAWRGPHGLEAQLPHSLHPHPAVRPLLSSHPRAPCAQGARDLRGAAVLVQERRVGPGLRDVRDADGQGSLRRRQPVARRHPGA